MPARSRLFSRSARGQVVEMRGLQRIKAVENCLTSKSGFMGLLRRFHDL